MYVIYSYKNVVDLFAYSLKLNKNFQTNKTAELLNYKPKR